MVRKTKEDALITRKRIIDAARTTFVENGVSQTSLEQIAKVAGVTRGAVYWHFENKTALFHAMREQVFLPLFDRMDVSMPDHYETNSPDPLSCLENFMLETIALLTDDQATRETYEIMMSKCEYVDAFAVVLQQILDNCKNISNKYEQLYRESIRLGLISKQCNPELLAADTNAFFGGLLHLWIKDHAKKYYRNHAEDMIKNHMQLRRMTGNI